MRAYELVALLPVEEDLYRKGRDSITEELVRQGAEIIKDDELGERQLAYSVKNQMRARYGLYTIKIGPEKLSACEKSFKLNTSILKYLFVRKDD